jgi:phytoene dehydrogenase-like protein
MGAVSAAIESSARELGAEVRTKARVARILTTDGAARGVTLDDGEELLAPVLVTAIHPRITFLQQLDASELPSDFVHDVESWRSRSGVVKINCALDRLPVFTSYPELTDQSGGVELAHSVAYLERAFEEARAGRAATLPFSDGVVPTVHDRSLAPDGKHVISLFTQWVPHEWSVEPHRDELEAYADRVITGYDELAPGFADSVLYRQVIGPYDMEHEWGLIGGNIFHGELSAEQLFHMRPAPGYADYRTPIRGLYQCSSATHAGGGVTGIPAYNCVREIKRDRAREALPMERLNRDRPEAHDVPVLHGHLVPQVAVLPADRRGRVHQLGPVQPHADPHALRRRPQGVLASAEPRDALGRGGRTAGRDHRARRGTVHAAAHPARPVEERCRPV